MKKLLLLLLATISTLTAKSQTSVYHPFPDSSAVWNYHFYLLCWMSVAADNYYSITIAGDTLINGQTYHKLNTPYIQVTSSSLCNLTNIGYRGAIRQDTANRKVFFFHPLDTAEKLLYDFNMQAGDTVKGFLTHDGFTGDTVQSVDSVLVGNSYRKRWNINPWYNISLIEGIGSTYGLIEWSPGFGVDFPDISLICFIENGITLYPDTVTNCELITNIENIYPEKYLTSVSPNPVTDKLNVTVNNKELSEFILYDIASKKLLHQKFTNSTTINTGQLSKGIYIYEVKNKNGVIKKGKIIKE